MSLFIENLLKDRINIPLSWIILSAFFILSLGIGYGGYRAGFQQNNKDVTEAKNSIASLAKDIQDLRYDLGRLKQSVDDLKDALDRKR